ncbi:unnamed protein product [Cunninghamella blakesleeana]
MTFLTSETQTNIVELVYFIISYRVNIYNDSISLPILDVMFSILIHYLYRSSLAKNHTQIGWLQGFFASIVMGCGGGSTVAILRGEPIGIFKSNEFWLIHGITYWLMFSNDQFYKLIHLLMKIPPIEYGFLISDGFLRAMAMLQFGVEGCNSLTLGGEDKYIAKLICGTLAGIGGGFFMDAFQLNQPHWSFCTPKSLKVISGEMKITFLTVCFYLLSKKEGNIYLHYFGTTKYIDDLFSLPFSLEDVLFSTNKEAQAWSCILLTLGLILNSLSSPTSWWNYLTSSPVNTTSVILKKKNKSKNKNHQNENEKVSPITKKNPSSKKKNQAKKLD